MRSARAIEYGLEGGIKRLSSHRALPEVSLTSQCSAARPERSDGLVSCNMELGGGVLRCRCSILFDGGFYSKLRTTQHRNAEITYEVDGRSHRRLGKKNQIARTRGSFDRFGDLDDVTRVVSNFEGPPCIPAQNFDKIYRT